MRCNNCYLHQGSMSQVLPKGSSNPDVYFIIDTPDDEDSRYGQILSGARGRFLDTFLNSLGIDNFRVWSLVRCVPYSNYAYDENLKLGDEYHYPTDTTTRSPNKTEIDTCSKYLEMDIIKSNPKLIVPLGGIPLKWLMGDNYSKITKYRGKMLKTTIGGNEFKVVPTFSPTYVIKNQESNVSRTFFDDLKMIKQICDGTWVNLMEENKMTYALSYNDFKSYYVKELMNEKELAYDIETNAELVFDKRFDIIGFSLAKKRNGIYVCLKSLDHNMPDDEIKMCKKLLVAILGSTEKIYVHNCLYERPATLYNLGYDIPYENLDDTLVMAKLMLGGKTGAGLKPNAQKIGYPSWDDDLSEYIDLFKTILTRLKLKSYQFIVEGLRSGKSLDEILNDLVQEDIANGKSTNQTKYKEFFDYMESLRKQLLNYYEESDLNNLLSLYSKAIIKGYDEGIPSTIPYNWIPCHMLCRYGATDSLATFDLKDHYYKRFKEESTKDVNLFEGYKYALMEHYAGHNIIMSGMKWDDDAAQLDYDHFNKICLESLRYLFNHPKVQAYVLKNSAYSYFNDIVYEYYNDIFEKMYQRKVICVGEDENGNNQYKVEMPYKNTGKIRKQHIKHLFDGGLIDQLPESLRNDLYKKSLDKIMKVIRTTDSVDVLKGYFNPASTVKEVTNLAIDILVTPELKHCHFIRSVKTNVMSHEDYDINKFSDKDRKLLDMLTAYFEIDKEHYKDRVEPFNEINEYVDSVDRFDDKMIQESYGWSFNLTLDGLDDTSQILVYDDLCVGPINPDDDSSWTDLFKWLVNLRSYKKSVKIISAYIDGKVGRKSVWVVEKKSLENGDDVSYRIRPYYECEVNEKGQPILGENETFLEQTNFGVGTAETGRWRSPYHVIPTGSSVKKLYKSRYRGGTILQPDFSANELRCIASSAHEDNMLKAFADGLDIHRSNASKIYNVPYDEVTTFQRRFAKTMSFSTIYGASEKSVADNYFNGDMAKAHKLFSDFYGAFPKLKAWIEERRKECLETHKVSVLTQRFLNIDFDENDPVSVSRAKRQAGNYPVQSSASTVAAVVFCDIIRHQKAQGLTKTKPICFIHDSLESDVYPYELLKVIEYQQYELANGAKDYFGLALKADLSMGLSMGDECELEEIEFLDEDRTKGYLTLKGWRDEIMNTVENWKLAYHKVEVVEDNTEEVYTPMSQMFIPKKAYDPSVLSYRNTGKMKIYIQYYNDKGEIDPMYKDKSEAHITNIWDNSPLVEKLGK